jgi:hypothetical protein
MRNDAAKSRQYWLGRWICLHNAEKNDVTGKKTVKRKAVIKAVMPTV